MKMKFFADNIKNNKNRMIDICKVYGDQNDKK